MGALERGECGAVIGDPREQDRGHFVVPDQRVTDVAEYHADRDLDRERGHQHDHDGLEKRLVTLAYASEHHDSVMSDGQ
ncbi:hypothetical protein D3C83_10280 [compost metagenome]